MSAHATATIDTPSELGCERVEIARASVELNRPFAMLRFPERLEQRFLREGMAARIRYLTVTGIVALSVFNGFLIADFLMVPDVFPLSLKVRLGIFTPLSLLFIVSSSLCRDWYLRQVHPLALECVVLASGVGAAACLAQILAASRSPLSQYYHVGLIVVVMYGNLLQRLRFWYALLFSVTLYAIHIGGLLTIPAFNPRLVLPMGAMVGATVIFTLMANHALERDERRRYLLSLRRQHVLADLAEVNERLQRLSRIDPLTGLYNRRHAEDCLALACQRARHDGGSVALIMIDVDFFKHYNDHYGHPAGDACLAHVAAAMTESVRRPEDIVARMGGEEFLVILPGQCAQEASMVAERIRGAVQGLRLPHACSSMKGVVTVSLGVACTRTVRPLITPAGLLAAADAALYEAKRAGRNRVVSR